MLNQREYIEVLAKVSAEELQGKPLSWEDARDIAHMAKAYPALLAALEDVLRECLSEQCDDEMTTADALNRVEDIARAALRLAREGRGA